METARLLTRRCTSAPLISASPACIRPLRLVLRDQQRRAGLRRGLVGGQQRGRHAEPQRVLERARHPPGERPDACGRLEVARWSSNRARGRDRAREPARAGARSCCRARTRAWRSVPPHRPTAASSGMAASFSRRLHGERHERRGIRRRRRRGRRVHSGRCRRLQDGDLYWSQAEPETRAKSIGGGSLANTIEATPKSHSRPTGISRPPGATSPLQAETESRIGTAEHRPVDRDVSVDPRLAIGVVWMARSIQFRCEVAVAFGFVRPHPATIMLRGTAQLASLGVMRASSARSMLRALQQSHTPRCIIGFQIGEFARC